MRSVSKPKASFSHLLRLARWLTCTRCRSTGPPRRHGRACWPWRLQRRSCELWRPACPARLQWAHDRAPDAQHGSSGAMNQDLAKVDVASLTDAEQLGLASGRVLPRHNAQPRCELPALAKGSARADGSNDGCRNHRPDTRDLPDTGTAGVRSRNALQFVVELFTCRSTVFHSSQSVLMRLRIKGVRSASAFSRISALAALSFAGIFANTRPLSSRNARSWLITAVRREISRSRTRWIACRFN